MRANTEIALKKYAVKTFGNKKNIEAVEKVISKEEEIIYIAGTNITISININSTKSTIPGAIAITAKNIYIYSMINSETSILPINQAMSVDFSAGGFAGAKFMIKFADMTIVEFTASYQKDLATKLFIDIDSIIKTNTLDVALAQVEQKQSDNAGTPDELRKYKSLLDDGIITQEEFELKKKQLLGI